MDQKEIFIAAASDDNYASHTAVMLVSLLANLDKNYSANIKILDAGISGENKGRISVSLGRYSCVFKFISVPSERFAPAIGRGSHLSSAAYSRLLLPELFPDLNKIIYLDGDLIVKSDISRLWQTDLQDKQVAAAPALFLFYYDLLSKMLGLSPENGFFNSGVMVLDLKKMRENDFTVRVLDFLRTNQNCLTNAADQDVLNAFFHDDYRKLDLKWNETAEAYIGRGYENTAAAKYNLCGREEFFLAQKEPAIVHFDGALKPWHIGLFHPFKKLYFDYLAQTEFKNLKKQLNIGRLFYFYAYYGLKFLPKPVYGLLLPLLKKIYQKKNFRPKKI